VHFIIIIRKKITNNILTVLWTDPTVKTPLSPTESCCL